MNKYYQNKETGVVYRVYHQSKECLRVFKIKTNQYFDGLLELEHSEEEIGTVNKIDECFELMI